jgi:nicotinamide-nucleotide amidase
MAHGALARFEADVSIAVTGIAGPDGGSEEKPVGTVFWCAATVDGEERALTARVPGGRAEVRDRSTTVAMHLVRRLLHGDGPGN